MESGHLPTRRGHEPTASPSEEGSLVLCEHIADSPPGRGEGVGWFMGSLNSTPKRIGARNSNSAHQRLGMLLRISASGRKPQY